MWGVKFAASEEKRLIKSENPSGHKNLRSIRKRVAVKLVTCWRWRLVFGCLCGLIVRWVESERGRQGGL